MAFTGKIGLYLMNGAAKRVVFVKKKTDKTSASETKNEKKGNVTTVNKRKSRNSGSIVTEQCIAAAPKSRRKMNEILSKTRHGLTYLVQGAKKRHGFFFSFQT